MLQELLPTDFFHHQVVIRDERERGEGDFKNKNSYNKEEFSHQNLDLFVPSVKRHEIARHELFPKDLSFTRKNFVNVNRY